MRWTVLLFFNKIAESLLDFDRHKEPPSVGGALKLLVF